MEKIKIFDAELRMMDILWELEPVSTGELSKVCRERLDWNKSTTYTVIRRLVERNVIDKQRTILKSKLTKKQVQKMESAEHISKMYSGSLKDFFEIYLSEVVLTEEDLTALKQLLSEK